MGNTYNSNTKNNTDIKKQQKENVHAYAIIQNFMYSKCILNFTNRFLETVTLSQTTYSRTNFIIG